MTENSSPSVGEVAYAALAKGLNNEEVLAQIKEKCEGSNASLASVNWYRGKARKKDPSIPTARELRKQAREKAKALDS